MFIYLELVIYFFYVLSIYILVLQEKKEKLKADKQERKRRLVHEQTILREVVKEAGQSTLNSVLTDIPNIETESSDEDSKSEAKDPVYREVRLSLLRL